MAHVLILYCPENEEEVAELRRDIVSAGLNVWSAEDIKPGQAVKAPFREAMRQANHIIICFSKEVQQRGRSELYHQIQEAISLMRERLPGVSYLLPVRLSHCEIPDFEINATTTLRDLRCVDLFPTNVRKERLQDLLESLGARSVGQLTVRREPVGRDADTGRKTWSRTNTSKRIILVLVATLALCLIAAIGLLIGNFHSKDVPSQSKTDTPDTQSSPQHSKKTSIETAILEAGRLGKTTAIDREIDRREVPGNDEPKLTNRGQGLKALRDSDFAAAHRHFLIAANQNSSDPTFDWELAGEAAVSWKNYAAAIEDYTRAHDLTDANDAARKQGLRTRLAYAQLHNGMLLVSPEGYQSIKDAVSNYSELLVETSENGDKTVWATRCNNLAEALVALGERTSGKSGIDHINQAITYYRKILHDVYTRDSFPSRWAETRLNLAIAFQKLGKKPREKHQEHFRNATNEYWLALSSLRRDEDQYHWMIANRGWHYAQIDESMCDKQWNHAFNVAEKLVKFESNLKTNARLLSASLTLSRFDACLTQAVKLTDKMESNEDPVAVMEVAMIRTICYVALGNREKADQELNSFPRMLRIYESPHYLDGPWYGLECYIAETNQERLVANRELLLRCLEALQLEKYEDVINATKNLPKVK